jgi:hypothetical protein
MLRDVVSLTLSKIEIDEIASLPSGRADVAHALVERSPVLDLVNLDDCVTFLDGDWELLDALLSAHFMTLPVLQPSCKRYFLCRLHRETHGLKIHVSAVRFRPQPFYK